MKSLAAVLCFVMLTIGGYAMIETLNLEQLAHGADAIFMVKVSGVKSTGKLPEGPEVMANLCEVTENLKGDAKPGEKVKVKTYSGVTDNATFTEGSTYLLFLKKTDSHYEIFNGLQGCWPVARDGSFSGMGHGKNLDQVKAAIESIPLKLQPKFEPLSL